jgi:radical SAM/Cys-rich protein
MQTIQSQKEMDRAGLVKKEGCDFVGRLSRHKLDLSKDKITTLQINIGLLCNQACRHCHLEAGPRRKEMMTPQTVGQVVGVARRFNFNTIDITGGAPELHPMLGDILQRLRPFCRTLILRSNLTALSQKWKQLSTLFKDQRVTIVASLPSLYEVQAESVRGQGSFQESIKTLKKINRLGYGDEGSGLVLDLVVNPSGAFLPPAQSGIEKRYKKVLVEKWGIAFNKLYSFANVPLGRFKDWLIESNNFEAYQKKLVDAFNPATVKGLMCRNMLSVSWDGYLFDCDFNQALKLFMGKNKTHLADLTQIPGPGELIAVGDHCYTCTAGAGFT